MKAKFNVCVYCGIFVINSKNLPQGHPRKATREHLKPKSQGGRKIAIACLRCNLAKGDMSEEHFRCLIKEYGFTSKLQMACRAYFSRRDKEKSSGRKQIT